jgi:hypothetical protein
MENLKPMFEEFEKCMGEYCSCATGRPVRGSAFNLHTKE